MRCVCMKNNDVMIRIKKELRDALKKKKKYDRETYSDVLKREIMRAKKYG